ncbi:MAG TPA: hypothetical protein PLC53_03095, partial [Bacilli bacterium]|nr:hypothetical protein [Bacilli bacterium]
IAALMEIIPNETQAYRLLSALDMDMLYNDVYCMYGNTEAYQEEMKQGSKEEIFYCMNNYFYSKFGYPMTLDAIMMLYYKSAYLRDNDIKLKISNIPNNYTYFSYPIIKGYFIDSFIQDYPEATTTVEYLQSLDEDGWGGISFLSDEYKEIQITDENRRLLPIQTSNGEYLLKVEDAPKKRD